MLIHFVITGYQLIFFLIIILMSSDILEFQVMALLRTRLGIPRTRRLPTVGYRYIFILIHSSF